MSAGVLLKQPSRSGFLIRNVLKILFFPLVQVTGSKAMSSTCSSNKDLAGVFSVSYVTVPDTEVAKTLAEKVVKEKLAACVNIIPGVTSIYEWKNEIQKDNEALMLWDSQKDYSNSFLQIIKSRTSRLDEMTKFIKENHPYEVCEVISTPIQHGNPAYLKWLGDIVTK